VTPRAFRRIAVIVLGAPALAACAHSGRRDQGRRAVSERQEIRMDMRAHQTMLKKYAAPLQTLALAWRAGCGLAQEPEADRLGAGYLARSGYTPQAAIEVIGKLKNQERSSAEHAALDGRPPRASRYGLFETQPGNDARLRQGAAEANPYPGNPREGRADYPQEVADLNFGDSPDRGAIRGNMLLREKSGMTKDAPAYERERGALRAAINSFQAIAPAEKLVARPNALQSIAARPGFTMASLARRSPGADAGRQLRQMNDLYPSDGPRTGQPHKIVQ